MATIKIDGKDYDLDKLSDAVKLQLAHLQATDAELRRLNMQLAIHNAAKSVYAKALKAELEKSSVGS